jgi:hypothetical protein
MCEKCFSMRQAISEEPGLSPPAKSSTQQQVGTHLLNELRCTKFLSFYGTMQIQETEITIIMQCKANFLQHFTVLCSRAPHDNHCSKRSTPALCLLQSTTASGLIFSFPCLCQVLVIWAASTHPSPLHRRARTVLFWWNTRPSFFISASLRAFGNHFLDFIIVPTRPVFAVANSSARGTLV